MEAKNTHADGPPADRQRRARAVLACAAAALLLLLAVSLHDARSAAWRDTNYGGRLERLRLRLQAAGPERRLVVALGTSRLEQGLYGRSIEGELGKRLGRSVVIANFGRAGNGPCCSMLTWRRLRRDGVRPDLLVVEVLPALVSLNVSGGDLEAEKFPETCLSWADLDVIERYASARRPQARRIWLRELPGHVYEHRGELVARFAPSLVPPTQLPDSGLVFEEMPENPDDDAAWHTPERRRRALELSRSIYAGILSHFRLGGTNCEALRDLLAECRRDAVPVALLLMPEGATFRSWYAPGVIEEVRAWLDELRAEFGVTVLDAREWMEEDDFEDSHHLTRDGARRFSQRLGAEHLLPLLRSLP
jgi:hypothetical protein